MNNQRALFFVLTLAAIAGIAIHLSVKPTDASEAKTASIRIVAIRASQAQSGNGPTNILDTSAESRWAAQGKGQWIQLDFSAVAQLTNISIGFYRSDRKYRFDLMASQDGKTFTKISSYTSDGKRTSTETFTFKSTKTKHLRIVMHGSSANDWANIHTVKIPGASADSKLATSIAKQTAKSKSINTSSATKSHGSLVATEFAKSGMVGSVVGITVDEQGNVYVSNTNRRNNAALDIRRNRSWLHESLASKSVEDKRKLIHARKKDWDKLAKYKELIIKLTDTDGDGKADKRTVIHQGFNTEVHGLAGGVLWHDGAAYVTCIPGLYKLTDTDGDGIIDKEEELVRGFGIHIGYGGHDMHGPTVGPDGRIYWSIGDKGIGVTLPDGSQHLYQGHGGVMRIETDGSGFEVFAHGLRNPQELAFDEYGNLFTVDNDGDFGDKERFHFVVENTDSGWRAHHQYRGKAYNPWMADGLFKPKFDKQPHYLTPPLSNYSAGPIGFEYNPGTALNKQYQKYFFLAHSNKKITAFQVEPNGAGFKMTNEHTVASGAFVTGIRFGPDGSLYMANWGNNAWAPHNNGSVLKLDVPADSPDAKAPLRINTKNILAKSSDKFTDGELMKLLEHADQRVRLKGQFELVKRGDKGIKQLLTIATSHTELLPRIHAIWGIGQAGRQDALAVKPLIDLLKDSDDEIKAQVAKVIGDAKLLSASTAVGKLLVNPNPRVRLFAGIALSKLAGDHLNSAIQIIVENNDQDAFVRHAGIMAMLGVGKFGVGKTGPSKLVELSKHNDSNVRRAAVVALRRLNHRDIARFLSDTDEQVAAEAARAIHDDQSIMPAMPALAAVLEQAGRTDEALLRRAISANLRLGDADSAKRLVAYAANRNAPEKMRIEALATLTTWLNPEPLGRVQGFFRGLPPRIRDHAAAAYDAAGIPLLSDPSNSIQTANAKFIKAIRYTNALDRITVIAFDQKADANLRAVALEGMAALKSPRTKEAIGNALASDKAPLRIAGMNVLANTNPSDSQTLAAINTGLKRSTLEKQAAARALGTINTKQGNALLTSLLEQIADNALDADIQLDVYQAAKASRSNDLQTQAKAIEKLLAKQPAGLNSLALQGGDAKSGESLLKTSGSARCLQCHRIEKNSGDHVGTDVGPNLAGLATRRDRAYILRAITQPSADIEERYKSHLFELASGDNITGSIVKQSNTALTIAQPDGKQITINKQDIDDQRSTKLSIMPDMTKALTLNQFRDLVAYLSTLK